MKPGCSIQVACALFLGALQAVSGEGATVVFETHFEPGEGYDSELDLVGQNGWVGEGSGGNGLIPDGVAGLDGQVAYVGFTPPVGTNDVLSVWRPVNLKPVGNDVPIIRFTVAMQIADSSTNAPFFDDFRWSVYNADPSSPRRLFSVDFDNDSRQVNYLLDDGRDFQPTGYGFENGVIYDLAITLNLARNLWTAEIGGAVVVNSAPITTTGAQLSLGDIDAVWGVRTAGRPGDNYMIFDDYRITAEPISSIPATLEAVGVVQNSTFLLRLMGEPGLTYAIETSSDFSQWTEVGRLLAQSPSGTALYQEPLRRDLSGRYFRARSIAP